MLRRFGKIVINATVALSVAFGAFRIHGRPFQADGRWMPAKVRSGIRVMTWNLRNFPFDHHDIGWIERQVVKLTPDVIAFEEIVDGGALAPVVPGFSVLISTAGGQRDQHLAIAFDPRRIELVKGPDEDARISLEGRARPAFSARFRELDGGAFFTLIAVHLKATPSGFDLRQGQWLTLAELVQERLSDPVIVLGDFNSTGPRGGDHGDERAMLERLFAPLDVHVLDTIGGCTAYWQGVTYDAWLEPSILDLVLLGPGWGDSTSLKASPMSHCAAHRCRPFRSTDAYPEHSWARVSDHCPVVVDLPRPSMVSTTP